MGCSIKQCRVVSCTAMRGAKVEAGVLRGAEAGCWGTETEASSTLSRGLLINRVVFIRQYVVHRVADGEQMWLLERSGAG